MVILISAKQCAGKTSLTEKLRQVYPTSFYIKFAKPLYEIQDLVYTYLGKYGVEYCEKDGPLLQQIGEHFRKKNKDIWCNIAKKQIEEFLSTNKEVCVINDDQRHENEFDIFSNFNYPVARIRLECPEEVRKHRGGTLWRPDTTHPSEVGLDEYAKKGMFDFYVDTGFRSKDDTFNYVKNALDGFIQAGKFTNKGDYIDLFHSDL